jgi:putative FmdB family regulatory protein
MPIYAYRCAACGHSRDVLQKLSDPAVSTCPACGAEQFQKQLTAPGFQLKGSGWYATDFRNGSAAAASKPAESTEAAKSESTSSDKPAAAGGCGTSCACH